MRGIYVYDFAFNNNVQGHGFNPINLYQTFFGLNFSRFYLITLSSIAELPTVAAATGVALPAG